MSKIYLLTEEQMNELNTDIMIWPESLQIPSDEEIFNKSFSYSIYYGPDDSKKWREGFKAGMEYILSQSKK